MKAYQLIFSPTGGTAKAADLLCSALDPAAETIDLSAQDFGGHSIEHDSVAVIAMPSFGGRAPKAAIDRLHKVNGNGAKAVLMAVYGNRAQEDTLIEMLDAAKAAGFVPIAAVSAVAEHSIAHQYASGRPDEADAEQLRGFAAQIMEKLASSDAEPAVPGDRPYKKAGAGLVPKASSACVGCGLCAEKCPVGAIDKAAPKKTDKAVCIGCMRCVSLCPKQARAVSPMMVKLVGSALKNACADRKDDLLYL